MLLLEEKNESSRICYFDSSNILACKYNIDESKLAIIFKRGAQYVFENVSNYTFQRFKIATSQGKRFNEMIKDKFKYYKVDQTIDVTPIVEQIETIKKQTKS